MGKVVFASILLAILAVGLIVVIVIQPSKGEGLGSIGGGGQVFFAKNKNLEKMLEKITTWLAIAFVLLAIIVSAME